ncbi:hypothetical protein Tco_0111124 [Tanacetum coccineum]
MVRNPCVWPVPMNKMAGTPLGEMADQTVVGSVHNSDHGDFASGYSYGGSLKASCIGEELRGCDDPMLKLIDIPGMLHLEGRLLESRRCLLLLGKLTLIVRNPYVWPAPMNKMAGTPLGEMADQTVVGSVHNSDHGAFASGASCGVSLKASDSSPLVSPTAIINMSRGILKLLIILMSDADSFAKTVSIQDKPGSYIAAAGGSRPKPSAAGGSKLDPSISKAKFRSLFSENLCEGVYVSIPRKVVEAVSIRFANTFY